MQIDVIIYLQKNHINKRACYRFLDDYLGFGRTIWDSTRSIWDSDLQHYGGTYMFVNMRRASHMVCFDRFVLSCICRHWLQESTSSGTIERLDGQYYRSAGEDFLRVQRRGILMPDSLRNKPKLVIYIDSTECTTCRISHLWEYQTLFDLSSQTGSFYVMILMWNTEFKSIPLVRYLLDQNVTYPVFVDLNRSFLKDNSTIPDDIRMHSLLLDSLNKVKFVGDPSATTNMLEVFKQALEGNDME